MKAPALSAKHLTSFGLADLAGAARGLLYAGPVRLLAIGAYVITHLGFVFPRALSLLPHGQLVLPREGKVVGVRIGHEGGCFTLPGLPRRTPHAREAPLLGVWQGFRGCLPPQPHHPFRE